MMKRQACTRWAHLVAGIVTLALLASCGSEVATIEAGTGSQLTEAVSMATGQQLRDDNGWPCVYTQDFLEWGDPYLDQFFETATNGFWFDVDVASLRPTTTGGYSHTVEGSPLANSGGTGQALGATETIVVDSSASAFPVELDVGEKVLVVAERDRAGRFKEEFTFAKNQAGAWYLLAWCGSPRLPALEALAASEGFSGADMHRWILGVISPELPSALAMSEADRTRILESVATPADIVDTQPSLPTWEELRPSERSLLDAPEEMRSSMEIIVVFFELGGITADSNLCTRTPTGTGLCIGGTELLLGDQPFPADRFGPEQIEVLLDGEVIGEIPADTPAGSVIRYTQTTPTERPTITQADLNAG